MSKLTESIGEVVEELAETGSHRAQLAGKALRGEAMSNVEKLDLVHGRGIGGTISDLLNRGISAAAEWTVNIKNGGKGGRVK